MKLTKRKFSLVVVSVVLALGLTGYTSGSEKSEMVLEGYANIAFDNYSDTLKGAKVLQNAINKFAKNPTNETLETAKIAWIFSRESYGQSEIFRLSNGPIDAEEGWIAETYGALEGQINAWPLDENMIDYTIDVNGNKTSGNIIDTIGSFNPGGNNAKVVYVTNITIDAITALNENGGDANVATGYHAVEFLLWGQDQDYANFIKDGITNGPLAAGKRDLSDFTSDVNAPRRIAYLQAATDKIVADIEVLKGAWAKSVDGNNGLYREAFLGKGKNAIDTKTALKQIHAGIGVFVKSELANERIAIPVLTPSEEDEHSCFSDNTHRDIATNFQGFKNVLMGTYKGMFYGNALIDALDAQTQKEMLSLIESIQDKIDIVDITARESRHFDYQIRPTDPNSKVIVKMKNEMRKLGDMMVDVAKANGVNLTLDDVTDAEETQI